MPSQPGEEAETRKRVWPEPESCPSRLVRTSTPPHLSPAGGHSYPAGGPAAVPPPQGSEQPFHRAAGLHGGWLSGFLAAGPEQCWGLAWGFLEAAWPRQLLPLGGGEAVWLVCGEAWPWKWREVQAGRGQVAAPGSGVGEDVGEARRSDSQDLPCWECQLRSLALPNSGAASHPVGHRVQGSGVLRSSPGISQ